MWRRPYILGIAGGIGAGKSAVARMLAEAGCAVSDSDGEARLVLDAPDVRATLRSWWGEGVLTPEGLADRRAIGAIVFAEPSERRRLEALVHPRLHARRRDTIRQAAKDGREVVVVDAPLLFEAGVDRACDGVLFVDAPLEVREARVRAGRGWAPGELARREAQQMPIEEKRRRSVFRVVNDGSTEALRAQVREVLASIRTVVMSSDTPAEPAHPGADYPWTLPSPADPSGADPVETTLIILKPDAVQRALMGRIIARFEDKGLQVVGCKLMQIPQDLAARHYEAHRERPFYAGLVRFMTSAPVLVLALRGVGAIAVSRKMMGATFGSKAEPGTIRGDFGVSNSYNLIHGSDSPEAAAREIGLFFKAGEVLEYPRVADQWVYDYAGGKPE